MSTTRRLEQLRDASDRYRDHLRTFLGDERYGLYRYVEKWMGRKKLDRRYFITGASLLAFGRILESRASERDEAISRELVSIKLAFGRGQLIDARRQASTLLEILSNLRVESCFAKVTSAAAAAVIRDCGTPIVDPSPHGVHGSFLRMRNVSSDVIWRQKNLGDAIGLSSALAFHSNLERAYLMRVPEATLSEAESLAELALKYARLGPKRNPARLLAEYQALLRKLTLRLWYRKRPIHGGLQDLEGLAMDLAAPSLWAELLILQAGQDFLIDRNLDNAHERMDRAEEFLRGKQVPLWLWLRLWRQQIQVLRQARKFDEANQIVENFTSRWTEVPDVYQASSLPVPMKPLARTPSTPIVGAGLPGFYAADVLERTSAGLLLPGTIGT